MSDTSQGPGWWQASDGKWYPPEQAPGYQPPAPAAGRWRARRRRRCTDIGAAAQLRLEQVHPEHRRVDRALAWSSSASRSSSRPRRAPSSPASSIGWLLASGSTSSASSIGCRARHHQGCSCSSSSAKGAARSPTARRSTSAQCFKLIGATTSSPAPSSASLLGIARLVLQPASASSPSCSSGFVPVLSALDDKGADAVGESVRPRSPAGPTRPWCSGSSARSITAVRLLLGAPFAT